MKLLTICPSFNFSFHFSIKKLSVAVLVLWLFAANSIGQNSPADWPYRFEKQAVGDHGMVVAAHPIAAEIGKQILQKGGNAVDASVAVQFALAVVYPQAGNLGGGGFMVFRSKTGETATLDYREMAPARASRDMYLDENGKAIVEKSLLGHLAAGVPGTVDGLVEAHKKYGRLPWKTLVQPAIDVARNGFRITKQEADNLNEERADFEKANIATDLVFCKKTAWLPGDLLVQKDLGNTLARISKKGRAGFYEGKTAHLIELEMRKGGGLISTDDLKNYHSVWRKPLIFNYKDCEIISMPPPSSGGIALAQLLKMVEPYPLSRLGFQSTEAVHLAVEAERRVYSDRAEHLGDPDFWPVPVEKLLDVDYLKSRMKTFDPAHATKSANVKAGNFQQKESEQTTHLSIVDTEGNAVSVTTTLNGSYGSHTVVGGAGFILNNEMDDFSVKPGQPNLYGLVGGEANAIVPGKRMLSSMTPTIVTRAGKLFLVVGTPGGSTIITSVFQVILNVVDFGKSLSEAVAAPRFHSQWLPDKIFVEENAVDEKSRQALEKKGHVFQKREAIGRVEAILVRPDNKLEGAADHRGDDHASGF